MWDKLPPGSYQINTQRPDVLWNSKGMSYYGQIPQKEDPMSTARIIAQEKRIARERVKIEEQYDAWDNAFSQGPPTYFGFVVGPKQRRAAACNVEGTNWSVTGGPTEVSWEDLLAWFIENGVTPGDQIVA